MSGISDPAKKTYRTPRRRPAHLRVKTGCLPCRERKKKCPEQSNPCDNCVKRRVDCVWPSRQHVHLGTTKDSPRSAEAVDSGTKVNTVSAASTLEDHARSQLFQYMREVFIPSLMSSSNAQQSSQELITDSLELAEQVEFFLQALLACSALEIKSDDAIYRELAREYYTQAVSGLRTHLEGDDWKHVEFVALRTINLLCIYERHNQEIPDGASTHLRGAAFLIRRCCRYLLTAEGTLGHTDIVRVRCLEGFIYHVTTSFIFRSQTADFCDIDDAFDASQHALRTLERRGQIDPQDYPILGAPTMLFTFVRDVTVLYRLFEGGKATSMQGGELARQLANWCSWEGTLSPSERTPRVQVDSAAEMASWSSVAHGLASPQTNPYIIGCFLLLDHMISAAESSPSPMHSHFAPLLWSVEAYDDFGADYAVWPLFALGVTLADKAGQESLQNKIMTSFRVTKNGSMKRLGDMLVDKWAAVKESG